MENEGLLVDVQDDSLNGYEENALYENLSAGEAFEEVSYHAGADFIEDGRGIVTLDLEGDGDLDVFIPNYQRRGTLMRNDGPVGNWLQIKLVGTTSNRDAVGARLEAVTGDVSQVREVRIGEALLSGRTLVQHFGLRDATRVDSLTIRWPSGRVEVVRDVAANRRIRLVEGEQADER